MWALWSVWAARRSILIFSTSSHLSPHQVITPDHTFTPNYDAWPQVCKPPGLARLLNSREDKLKCSGFLENRVLSSVASVRGDLFHFKMTAATWIGVYLCKRFIECATEDLAKAQTWTPYIHPKVKILCLLIVMRSDDPTLWLTLMLNKTTKSAWEKMCEDYFPSTADSFNEMKTCSGQNNRLWESNCTFLDHVFILVFNIQGIIYHCDLSQPNPEPTVFRQVEVKGFQPSDYQTTQVRLFCILK